VRARTVTEFALMRASARSEIVRGVGGDARLGFVVERHRKGVRCEARCEDVATRSFGCEYFFQLQDVRVNTAITRSGRIRVTLKTAQTMRW